MSDIITACGKGLDDFLDDNGNFRMSIFRELNNNGKHPSYYTLLDRDTAGLLSARRIFLEATDEYEAAIQLVGTWQNWARCLRSNPFVNGPQGSGRARWQGLVDWRYEKELQDKSRARQLLWDSAEDGNVSAQRVLFDGQKEKAGRPSKGKVKQEATRMAREDKILEEGLERINKLRLVHNVQKDNTSAGNN